MPSMVVLRTVSRPVTSMCATKTAYASVSSSSTKVELTMSMRPLTVSVA